uniref:Uncharacterized protein n=1 Tax=Anguilla anguilla TaxID=7936 RepID=A0A0E9QUZ2_ANGAN
MHGISTGQVACGIGDDLCWDGLQVYPLQVAVATNLVKSCKGEILMYHSKM